MLKKSILRLRNRPEAGLQLKKVVARITRLREKGLPQIEPTDEERDAGLVKNDI
jgi:hypothetical protein